MRKDYPVVEVPRVFIAAAMQASPVFLDRAATVAKACRLIAEAADAGARLIVFPEAFIPGYPYWLWGDRPGTVEGLEQRAFVRLWQEAIDIPGPETAALAAAARAAGAVVAIGVNERESMFGRATLYNTLLTLGPDGSILSRHRKLMPTYRERTVWGAGDGNGLDVVDTSLGRIGGLICWENYMPLARYHAYAQGEQIHLAVTVDDSPSWGLLARTIAAEGRVFVVSVCQVFERSQFADEPLLSGFAPDVDRLSTGGSLIVAPGGNVLAGPLHGEEGMLTAELDLGRVIAEKHSLDVTGHYARPDVFRLIVNDRAMTPFDSSTVPAGEAPAGGAQTGQRAATVAPQPV
jgi:nitrilase